MRVPLFRARAGLSGVSGICAPVVGTLHRGVIARKMSASVSGSDIHFDGEASVLVTSRASLHRRHPQTRIGSHALEEVLNELMGEHRDRGAKTVDLKSPV